MSTPVRIALFALALAAPLAAAEAGDLVYSLHLVLAVGETHVVDEAFELARRTPFWDADIVDCNAYGQLHVTRLRDTVDPDPSVTVVACQEPFPFVTQLGGHAEGTYLVRGAFAGPGEVHIDLRLAADA